VDGKPRKRLLEIKTKPLFRGTGVRMSLRESRKHVRTSFQRGWCERSAAGDLAYRVGRGLQLRDSSGLSPASPLSPPIRGSRHRHCRYGIGGDYNRG
jgi:hypothetical protein